ncbi:hypothetical protein TIFTF001_034810 [Ficus carica]|uniref:Uncharacterized protein n=1 Tax=Ficus carica TaxID=3494 RepID=A0AA88JB06_FICCA|nr:hypothetical protein TIFTF001_034784 [Ficus carica]GMN65717.1 hypothetical protein TIFTF001_034789 [Ficus carica]GMN65736.1 hypothetical protein TIFTF001_034805 [Ficus carica]GMN65738.1 hypothetical protein TIFTF001_034810 [Ficus carica]
MRMILNLHQILHPNSLPAAMVAIAREDDGSWHRRPVDHDFTALHAIARGRLESHFLPSTA